MPLPYMFLLPGEYVNIFEGGASAKNATNPSLETESGIVTEVAFHCAQSLEKF